MNEKEEQLFEACKTGNHELAKKAIFSFLFIKGADVNAKDEYGNTPLIVASLRGYKDIAELLIEKGADVNAKDNDGQTSLFHATDLGYNDIAKLLIVKGAKK